jgi:hypothetical protein
MPTNNRRDKLLKKAQRLYADLCYDIHQADLQINLGDSDITDTFRRRFLKAMEPKFCGEDGNIDLEREMRRYGGLLVGLLFNTVDVARGVG